ncbi:MAG: DUF3098 domain-containing protein [Bergeyella sp.]
MEEAPSQNAFYFGKENFKWMLIGLAMILLGFILMMGQSANTRPDGTFDPAYWNDGIFSVVRIRIAPLLVIVGFVVEAYAILKRKK